MKKLIPQSIKNIFHLFQAVLANVWFGFPSRRMKVIGVTGTNGKTTTVQMIAKILEESGYKIAVASTINFKIGGKEWVNETKFTTLSSWRLQKHLREAAKGGCGYAIVEVTSHALDQNRVWGVNFSVAVITNVTREHLDYHETIDKYSRVKEKLFLMATKSKDGVSVVNLSMDNANKFLKHPAKEKYGYAVEFPISNFQFPIKSQTKNKKIIAEEIELGINYSKFKIQNSKFFLNLPGEFNIENALAAVCVGLSQAITLEKIAKALAKMKGVPGRMERIENNRELEIIVDYAVTPDSLEKLYAYINKFKKGSHPSAPPGHLPSGRGGGKIIAVFGSCGERDRGKRPIMGEIVAKYADYCIVTNEDPYYEDPVQIINEVFSGVVGRKVEEHIQNFKFQISNFKSISNDKISKSKIEGTNAFRILDRREAIKKALQLAERGDIIIVTGKGAEEIMVVGDKRISWNDPKVIRKALQEPD